MISISDHNFKGQKVLVRVDFNVPLDENNKVTDDTRIKAALPTLKKILADDGAVILMSHLGRPKGERNEKYSLKPVADYINHTFDLNLKFVDDCIGPKAIEACRDLKMGEILLLENLRFYNEEEKGNEEFSKSLAELGDMYINDAFGTAHRAHASTSIIAHYFDSEHKGFGMLMEAEVKNADKVLNNPERPLTAILGGAKVSDKLLILENLLDIADNIIVGGGMAYTFFKAMGGHIGNSLVEIDRLDTAKEIIKKAQEKGVALLLPPDSVVADKFSADANTQVEDNMNISEGWMGLDIGEKARIEFTETILASNTILWNGPMGVFEMPKFEAGTKAIAEAVAQATENGAFSLVGGGDSVAAVNKFRFENKVSYISTGGGAMLEFFEGKSLPGIEAIK